MHRTVGLAMIAALAAIPSMGRAQEPFDSEPLRTWVTWINALSLPQERGTRDLPELTTSYTSDYWAAVRVHIVLERLTRNCTDLTFQDFPFDLAIKEAVRSPVMSLVSWINPRHKFHEKAKSLVEESVRISERHGERLCRQVYAALGPGGYLINPFQRLTRQSRFTYSNQVVWRSKDICDRPDEYYSDGPPAAESIEFNCKEADKHKSYWGDY